MKNVTSIELELVESENRSQYLDYLLLADENESVVNTYINDGEMYSIHFNNEIVGVVLFTYHSNQVVELKNIALDPEYRCRGLGKVVIAEAFEKFKRRGISKLTAPTAKAVGF